MRLAAAAVLLAGCGGAVESVAAEVRHGAYTIEHSSRVDRTGPGEVAMLGISCERGEALVEGGCEVVGARLVQDETTGLGWTCAASSDVDGAALRVWVRCDAP